MRKRNPSVHSMTFPKWFEVMCENNLWKSVVNTDIKLVNKWKLTKRKCEISVKNKKKKKT